MPAMTPARATTGPETLARIRSCPGPMFCSTPVISTSTRSSFVPSKTVSPYPCMPLRTCENGMVLVVAADAAAETMVARATEMARSVRGTRALTHARNGAISRDVAAWVRIGNPAGDGDPAAFASADPDVAAVRVDDLARQGHAQA